jgi:uncharacterized YigZ family protein
MESDTYRTIAAPSEGVYKEKGSRFVANAYPVASNEDIRYLTEKIRKERHDARHHCFAYMLGHKRENWRVSDDGEPSGTAGKPILGQINTRELTNTLIIVSRYFGGTLLGVSGLINAYRTASAEALINADIVEKTVREYYEISFPYLSMNDVMKILKEEDIGQSGQDFGLSCVIKVDFRVSLKERILARLSRIDDLRYKFLEIQ